MLSFSVLPQSRAKHFSHLSLNTNSRVSFCPFYRSSNTLWSCIHERVCNKVRHHVRSCTWLWRCNWENSLYVRFNVLCMLSSQFSFETDYLQFKRFLQSQFSFLNEQGLRVYKTPSLNTPFSIRIFLSTFLFTLLFKQLQQLSGRDIICVPNALFISDRDFVQSFESRHGRHGNSYIE